jgi:hypothetical protein
VECEFLLERHLSFQDSIVDLGGYKRPRLAEEETSVSSAGRLGFDASAERTYLQW